MIDTTTPTPPPVLYVGMNDQPDERTKLDTLAGKETGWTFSMEVPPVPTLYWSGHDWIRWIGDRWRRCAP